jgi:hypothetical protein
MNMHDRAYYWLHSNATEELAIDGPPYEVRDWRAGFIGGGESFSDGKLVHKFLFGG